MDLAFTTVEFRLFVLSQYVNYSPPMPNDVMMLRKSELEPIHPYVDLITISEGENETTPDTGLPSMLVMRVGSVASSKKSAAQRITNAARDLKKGQFSTSLSDDVSESIKLTWPVDKSKLPHCN